MYATKPLSEFAGHPEAASGLPPAAEGGCSGYLAVKSDEEGADEPRWWGLSSKTRVRVLPFPQNRVITVMDPELGEYADAYADAVVFVPVPGVPLSLNRYYAVLAAGKHRGLVRACSREDEVVTRFFFRCIRDAKPRSFDPADVYQQMEIVPHKGGFTARSVAADGHPYLIYRSKRWIAYASKPKHFNLGEALGLNDPLRSRSLSHGHAALTTPTATAPVVVGRWYTPFFFIKEDGVPLKTQMERATFYEIVLEQRWEAMGAAAPALSKRVLVGGRVAGKEEAVPASARTVSDGYVWFSAATWPAGQRVGVHGSLWEKMVWEEQKGGWVADEEDNGVRTRMAGAGAGRGSVLVERFAVKRMDGSVAVAFDFFHVNNIN